MFGIFQESLGFRVISIEETRFTKKKEFQAFRSVLVSLRHSEPRATPPPQDLFLSLLLAEHREAEIRASKPPVRLSRHLLTDRRPRSCSAFSCRSQTGLEHLQRRSPHSLPGPVPALPPSPQALSALVCSELTFCSSRVL